MHTSALRPTPRRADPPSPPLSLEDSTPKAIYPWATPRTVTLNDMPAVPAPRGSARRLAALAVGLTAFAAAIAAVVWLS